MQCINFDWVLGHNKWPAIKVFLEIIGINDKIYARIHLWINADFSYVWLQCACEGKCTCPWEMQTEEFRSGLKIQCNIYQNPKGIFHTYAKQTNKQNINK